MFCMDFIVAAITEIQGGGGGALMNGTTLRRF